MNIDLSEQQRHDLEKGQAVWVTDSETNRRYALLPAPLYERVQDLLYDSRLPTDQETAHLAWETGVSIGWDDPKMAEYDDYDANRKPS